ncbi:MAG TPA: type IV pilus assembly protein PilM [Candidatus Paceibacterota bacterium]
MSFFDSFLSKQPILGVDIGTTSIKVAEVSKADGPPTLNNYGILETYGYLERFNEALQTSSLKLSEKNIAGYLKILLEHSRIRARTAIASIPAFLAFSTLIEAPTMSESEVRKFMEIQGKQYIPMPLSAVTIDWLKVGERRDESGEQKYQLLIVSIPNEQIEKYQNIFKASGLKLVSVEVEGMSIARSLSANLKEPALAIDIGSRSTSFSVVQNGFYKFGGQTDFSGGSLTQTIASGLSINPKRAEDLKKQRGLLGFGGEHELSTLIQPILDVIINEARRVIANYETSYQEKVASVILSGGGANLIGIKDYFNKNFGLPVSKGNPFSKISYPKILEPITKDTGPFLSVAIGLALKNFS